MRLQPVDSLLQTKTSLIVYFLFGIRLMHGLTCILPGVLVLNRNRSTPRCAIPSTSPARAWSLPTHRHGPPRPRTCTPSLQILEWKP